MQEAPQYQPEYQPAEYEVPPAQYDMAPPMSENPAPQAQPQQASERVQAAPSRGGLSGLRHQLRSQRQGLQQSAPQQSGGPKSLKRHLLNQSRFLIVSRKDTAVPRRCRQAQCLNRKSKSLKKRIAGVQANLLRRKLIRN